MANVDINILPGTLREIAELIGLTATMSLVERYGGVRLYVPKELADDHPIIKWIGLRNAVVMTDAYGGETLEIPKAEAALRELRNQEIRNQWPTLSQRQLALKYRTTERTIRNILGQTSISSQMDLFS